MFLRTLVFLEPIEGRYLFGYNLTLSCDQAFPIHQNSVHTRNTASDLRENTEPWLQLAVVKVLLSINRMIISDVGNTSKYQIPRHIDKQSLGKQNSRKHGGNTERYGRVLGEEYFLSVKQYSRSREICNPFGNNFTFDQAFFNFFGSVLFTTVSDRKYSQRFWVRAPTHSALEPGPGVSHRCSESVER